MRPRRRQPTRLPCPWDSSGKNTGVGCHFLLQCMKVRSESEVAQLCPTLRYPMDRSPAGICPAEIPPSMGFSRILWLSSKRVIMKDLMDHFMRSDLIQDAVVSMHSKNIPGKLHTCSWCSLLGVRSALVCPGKFSGGQSPCCHANTLLESVFSKILLSVASFLLLRGPH